MGANFDDFEIKFCYNSISGASITHNRNSKTYLKIALPIRYSATKILDTLNHEIGTHYVRKYNDKFQDWSKQKYFKMKKDIETEEGLASIAQLYEAAVSETRSLLLFKPALNYYSAFLASQNSFCDLYTKLKEFINDSEKLWYQCMRVKRGISNTSSPGGMFKDQSYFIGAINILKKRKEVNFQKMYSGKISLNNLKNKFNELSLVKDECIYPYFIKDQKKFMEILDKISNANYIV